MRCKLKKIRIGIFVWAIGVWVMIGNQLIVFAQSSPTIQTIQPTSIPFSAQEIVNSNRGFYKWRGGEVVPIRDGVTHQNSSYDVYQRFTWNQIELDNNVWTFSDLKNAAKEARARGGKFSFGIYSVCTSWCDAVSVPSDIPEDTAKYGGAWKGLIYVPDWNNQNFLDRAERMLKRINLEMVNDPEFGKSIGFIDIRMYGNWGEWHMSGLSGFPRITEASQKRIVDMHARAFPNTQLVMMSNGGYAFAYAMDLNSTSNPPVQKPIGWRNDCLGLHINNFNGVDRVVEHFRSTKKEPIPPNPGPENIQPPASDKGQEDWEYKNYWDAVAWDKRKDRWKVAPVVTEFCPLYPERKLEADLNGNLLPSSQQIPEIRAAINQTKDFHVAFISNGNIGNEKWYSSTPIGGTNEQKWAAFSTVEKQMLFELGKTAGFRFELMSLTLPQAVAPGAGFTVQSIWRNSGTAPDYDPWNTHLALYKNGVLVKKITAPLQVDFEKLLPLAEMGNTPSTFNDIVTFPSDTPEGTYDLRLLIEDKTLLATGTPYRKPLALAIQGRQADGSYTIGNVTVSRNIVVDSDCPKRPIGDANCDNLVNTLDYDLWRVGMQTKLTQFTQTNNLDFNNDARVDMKDFEIWRRNVGK